MSVLDQFNLKGRSFLVTGATGHLGKSMVWAIAQAGGTPLINSRSQEKCEALADDVRSAGLLAEAAAFDIRDTVELSDWFASREDAPLHGLINNAYAGGAGSIESAQSDAYRNSYAMSVVTTHELFQAALPGLRRAVKQTGDASVINIASMYGVVSPDLRLYASNEVANPPFYGAAKAALLQWTRYAACEFGKEGIRCNAISPGPFPADPVVRADPEFVDRLAKRVPLGRIGTSDEIGGVILLLASPASTFINGANIPVDGGWTSW